MAKLNYAKEQRLRTIEVLVQLYGSVRPKALMALFGISHASATRDFNAYKQLAPANLVYIVESQSYSKGSNFTPLYGEL